MNFWFLVRTLSISLLLGFISVQAYTSTNSQELGAALNALKEYLKDDNYRFSWDEYSLQNKGAFVLMEPQPGFPGHYTLYVASPENRTTSFFEWYSLERDSRDGHVFRVYADHEGFVPFEYQIPIELRNTNHPVKTETNYDFIEDIVQRRLQAIALEFKNAHPKFAQQAIDRERIDLAEVWRPVRTKVEQAIDQRRRLDQLQFAEIVKKGMPISWVKRAAFQPSCEMLFN